MLENLPESDQIAYLDRHLGRLAGTKQEHFGTDTAGRGAFLAAQLEAIEDAALRQVAFELARGFSLELGTSGIDALSSSDTVPAGLVRQARAEQPVMLGGEGDDTVDGRASGDTYVFRIDDGNNEGFSTRAIAHGIGWV